MNLRRMLGGLLALCAAALATTLPRVSTRDMVRDAHRVVCAECTSCRPRLDPRTGLVFTQVKLRVLETLKGAPEGATLELSILGGEAEGRKTVVSGMPRFAAGRESVLLLKRRKDGAWLVSLAHRGSIPILRDKKGVRHLGTRVSGFKDLAAKKRISLDAFRISVLREVRLQEKEKREKGAK
jgi:hypothetical protein